jgi:hypothetical protein
MRQCENKSPVSLSEKGDFPELILLFDKRG